MPFLMEPRGAAKQVVEHNKRHHAALRKTFPFGIFSLFLCAAGAVPTRTAFITVPVRVIPVGQSTLPTAKALQLWRYAWRKLRVARCQTGASHRPARTAWAHSCARSLPELSQAAARWQVIMRQVNSQWRGIVDAQAGSCHVVPRLS